MQLSQLRNIVPLLATVILSVAMLNVWILSTVQDQSSNTLFDTVPFHHIERTAHPTEPLPKVRRLPLSKTSEHHIPRPPLDSIVQGWNVTGDASWLLNFAIIGFPKCGTSSLMYHLQSHPQVQIFSDERCDMSYNQHVTLIRDLYKNFSVHDDRIARGIKCPLDLENTKLAMPNYQWLFPRTNYIVGIRHPVLWFESFYNFRIHNRFSMPPPGDLVGRCRRGGFNVCTFRGNFHLFLSNLGKTHMATDPDEQQYLAPEFRHTRDPIVKLPGKTPQKIFLYEVSQLSDPDPDRAADLRTTLQSFLNLTIPLDPMIWYRPGKQHKNQWELERLNAKKINICDAQHEALRTVLRYQAGNASRWIRHYFLDAPDVVTSSKEYLRNIILPSWERDPCLDRALSMS